MLLFSLPLVFTLVGMLTANKENKFQTCWDGVDAVGMDDLIEATATDELSRMCPQLLPLLKCLDDAAEETLGSRIAQLAETIPDTDVGKLATVFLNVQSIVEEVCEEGTDLHKAYIQHADCVQRIDKEKIGECVRESFSTGEEMENTIEEEIIEDPAEKHSSGECLRMALASACTAAEIHENCGVGAFETYQIVIKKLNIFRIDLCSQEDLDELKSSFLDSLNVEGERKDLFRLAFDLRKRRK